MRSGVVCHVSENNVSLIRFGSLGFVLLTVLVSFLFLFLLVFQILQILRSENVNKTLLATHLKRPYNKLHEHIKLKRIPSLRCDFIFDVLLRKCICPAKHRVFLFKVDGE